MPAVSDNLNRGCLDTFEFWAVRELTDHGEIGEASISMVELGHIECVGNVIPDIVGVIFLVRAYLQAL